MTCSRQQLHANVPIIDTFAWQARMLQTHKQVKCPGTCGQYVVFIPKLGRP